MTTTNTAIADAIREVTAKMQSAIDNGHRSHAIDADDVTEILLAIADRIDPPFPETTTPATAPTATPPCPECGNATTLGPIDCTFDGAERFTRCGACGTIFDPADHA